MCFLQGQVSFASVVCELCNCGWDSGAVKRLVGKRAEGPGGAMKAGDGNRTHLASLEGWCFTTKLHPHLEITVYYLLVIP